MMFLFIGKAINSCASVLEIFNVYFALKIERIYKHLCHNKRCMQIIILYHKYYSKCVQTSLKSSLFHGKVSHKHSCE